MTMHWLIRNAAIDSEVALLAVWTIAPELQIQNVLNEGSLGNYKVIV